MCSSQQGYRLNLTCVTAAVSFVPCRYITQQGHKLEVGAPRPPATVTNAVSWRSEGIKYRKNEVFMDVIESVNLLVRNKNFRIKNIYLVYFV